MPDDIDLLTASPTLADYYEHLARAHGDSKAAANWVKGEVLSAVRRSGLGIAHFSARPRDVAELLNLVRDGTISRTAGSRYSRRWWRRGNRRPRLLRARGSAKVDDTDALSRWLNE